MSAALLAESGSVHRTPPSSTDALLAALAPLERLGLTPEQAYIVGMGQFPIAGPASYTDDWLELRPGGHLHMGIDIDAAMGTPLRAPVSGLLRYDTSDPTGYGLQAVVTAPDGTYYRMAHMSATVLGLSTGSQVREGQVVGFVGESGDATGPHCHFEIHPLGGAGVDAKPFLDAWQAQAIDEVPALEAALEGRPAPTPPPTARAVEYVPPPPTTATTLPTLALVSPVSSSRARPPSRTIVNLAIVRPSSAQVTVVAAAIMALVLALIALTLSWPSRAERPSPRLAPAVTSQGRPRRRGRRRGP